MELRHRSRRPDFRETIKDRYWNASECRFYENIVFAHGWRDAALISHLLGTKTVTQVRTHTQKYLLKRQKLNLPLPPATFSHWVSTYEDTENDTPGNATPESDLSCYEEFDLPTTVLCTMSNFDDNYGEREELFNI